MSTCVGPCGVPWGPVRVGRDRELAAPGPPTGTPGEARPAVVVCFVAFVRRAAPLSCCTTAPGAPHAPSAIHPGNAARGGPFFWTCRGPPSWNVGFDLAHAVDGARRAGPDRGGIN